MEAVLDKGTPLGRDDPEDRAAADAHYEAVAPVWRGLAPKARLALVLPYVQSLGLLPKGLVRRLDAALRTGTPADKHSAAGLIGAIARDVPYALADLRPGAVVQAAAVNALAELGYSPERAIERAGAIMTGLASSNDVFAADDAAAIVGALERLLPGSSAGVATTPANWAQLIRRVVETIMRLWRRSDRRPPPNRAPSPTQSRPSAELSRLPGNGERILRRFPPERRESIRREFIETGRLSEIRSNTINVEVGGGMDAANRDFDRIVRLFGGNPAAADLRSQGMRLYRFPDGTTVNVRPTSSGGRPTVEIQSRNGYVARRY